MEDIASSTEFAFSYLMKAYRNLRLGFWRIGMVMFSISPNLLNVIFMSAGRVSTGRLEMKIVFEAKGGGGGRYADGFFLVTLIHFPCSYSLNGVTLTVGFLSLSRFLSLSLSRIHFLVLVVFLILVLLLIY